MPQIKSGRSPADVKLMVAMPSLDAKNYCLTTQALIMATLDCLQAGIRSPIFDFIMQESMLPHARNCAVATFMASDCTDLIFIDADMAWDRMAFLRLIAHPVDVVGATYRKKRPDTQYTVRYDANSSNADTGLLEVDGLPFGFIRITRRAIQQMINEFDPPQYEVGEVGLQVYKLFDFEFIDGAYVGEDFTFCRRYRSIGGKVWCDPELKVDHLGNYIYEGHFGSFARAKLAEQKAAEGKTEAPKPETLLDLVAA